MHYRWTSRSDFDTWHTVVCDALGIPHPNYNAATGELDLGAQWTTSYTEVIEVAADDWRSYVEDATAAQFPDELGIPSEAPPSPSREELIP
jgi:hypothetical protein